MDDDSTRAEQVLASEPTQLDSSTQQEKKTGTGKSEPAGTDQANEIESWIDLLGDTNRAYCAMNYGDIAEGHVIQIDEEEILVDIGAKSEGVVPSREFCRARQAGELDGLKIGDPVFIFVLKLEDDDGRAVLSIDRARLEKSWRWLEQAYADGTLIEALIDGYNKGGLLANVRGVRGFIPASQVMGASSAAHSEHGDSLAQFVGIKIPLKVIEINRRRNRLILSQRQALQGFRESRKEELLDSLEVGGRCQGIVSSVCNFGAFVDLGGADGLIHLSELSWRRVGHPREVVQVGQEVNVCILGIDRERKRIALSLRRAQPEPWTTVAERYQLGQLVKGEVTQLTSFGAFVRIEDGIEGLIHLSELSDMAISHPREVIQEGEQVTLRVIRIDPVHRRIGLSLRRALRDIGDEESEEEEEVGEGEENTDQDV